MATAGVINVFLNANTKNFDAGMAKARKTLTLFESAALKMTGVSSVLSVASQAFNVTAQAVGALADQVKRLDDIGDLSQRIGIDGNALQRIQHAIQLGGGDVEGFDKSLSTMRRNIGDFALGLGSAGKAFEKLNLTSEHLQKLGMEKAFQTVALRLHEIKDPTERASIATDLFGKSAENLMGVFEGGKSVFAQAALDVENFGSNLDDVRMNKIGKAADEMDKLKMQWQGLQDEMGLSFGPMLGNAMQGLNITARGFRQGDLGFTDINNGLQNPFSWYTSLVNARDAQSGRDNAFMSKAMKEIDTINWDALDAGLRKIDALDAGRSLARYGMAFPPGYAKDDVLAWRNPYAQLRAPIGPSLPPNYSAALDASSLIETLTAKMPELQFSRGTAALEYGTAEAFSALQASQRESEADRIQKQELQEAKKTNQRLEEVTKLLQNAPVLMTMDLQG